MLTPLIDFLRPLLDIKWDGIIPRFSERFIKRSGKGIYADLPLQMLIWNVIKSMPLKQRANRG